MSEITVIMPTYNSEKYVAEAIDSIRAQSFADWDLLVINELGSDDHTATIVQEYVQKDTRIRLLQNQQRLGLAESLNRGIRAADGKYIARMDADDISFPDRFQKQWEYLEAHEQVIVLGTAQHHFGPNTDRVHRPATEEGQLKANLLFMCDVCHSTVMMRRKSLIENDLFYDPAYMAEDYELWTRALTHGTVINLPEVMGEYRWGTENITQSKKKSLAEESGRLVANNLKQHLQMELSEKECTLMNGWLNPCLNIIHRQKNLKRIRELLEQVYRQNQKLHYVSEKQILQVIGAKWRWDKYLEPITNGREEESLEDIFQYRGYAKLFQRVLRTLINKI